MNPTRTQRSEPGDMPSESPTPGESALAADTTRAFGFDRSSDEWLALVRDSLSENTARLDEEAREDLDKPGQRIGPYELLSPIGMGGMGTVWRARRADKRPDRVVALKFIRQGMHSRSAERRFRLEEQVLARLTHPGIARLYDAGIGDTGRPYLVMECVEGEPILAYVKEHRPSVEQRLLLFRRVCEAVQHAHSALVLHRDIKPSNILVMSDGTPKLLDFGIAKLLDDQEESAASMTATDVRVLTPRYASPEQVRGERLTTATDVYSLGVIFYELLSGVSPYEDTLGSRRAAEHAVCEEVPQRPSAVVGRGEDLSKAEKRGLSWRLRGDLDTICATALRKDPSHRYHTPGAMAEDVRRHLEGLPLLARRAGVFSRSLRMMRRRRGAVLAALGGVVASALSGVLIVVYMFLLPGWVDDHVRVARSELVARTTTHAVYNILFFNNAVDRARTRMPDFDNDVGAAALAEYDAAMRLGEVQPEARIERDLLVLADAMTNAAHRVPELVEVMRGELPTTAQYATSWVSDAVIPHFEKEDLDQADQADIRALGFLAFLCGDYETSLEAWTRFQLATPDPLVELFQGYVYLALDEGALAYPRLLTAYRAYPDSGPVVLYLADAAARCGDTEQAIDLLERAQAMKFSDDAAPLDRIEMVILLDRGESDAAMAVYDRANLVQQNPVATIQLSRYFEEQEDLETALMVLNQRILLYAKEQAGFERYIRLMETWWAGLDEEAKSDRLQSGSASFDSPRTSITDLLRAYTKSIRNRQGSPRRHEFVSATRWTEMVNPISEDRRSQARDELLSLAASCAVDAG